MPNDGKALNDLVGTPVDNYAQLSSLSLSGVSLCRGPQPCGRTSGGFRSGHEIYTATVGNSLSMTTLSATAGGGARVTERYPDDADATTTGHQIALDIGTTDIEVEVVSKDNTDTTTYEVAVTRRAPSTVITGTITDAEPDEDGEYRWGFGRPDHRRRVLVTCSTEGPSPEEPTSRRIPAVSTRQLWSPVAPAW